MDNFTGQATLPVSTLLEDHDIHVCLLPPNTTDLLQPTDISVNKSAKDYPKKNSQLDLPSLTLLSCAWQKASKQESEKLYCQDHDGFGVGICMAL